MDTSANNQTVPGSPAPAIALRDVSKHYRLWSQNGSGFLKQMTRVFFGKKHSAVTGPGRDFAALRNITFEIQPGESVGIIGRNGCGKSTLLQILAGILKPTSGGGMVNGEVAALLELGTGFHPDFTGRENIAINNAILNLSREETRQRTERIEAFADIGRFMDEPIRTYSSGMMLRLGFACAVAVDPDVFLVDEALSVGDIFFQQKCFEFMREQMGTKTRVIVSHDMHSITTFCSRVMVLEAGTIVFDGPPLQAVEFYIKALHDNQAGATRGDAAPLGNAPSRRGADWRIITAESVGGVGEVAIKGFELHANGIPFTGVAKPGDVIGVRMAVECREAKSCLLFGYLMRDKTGNAIFGENSASVPRGIVQTGAGELEVMFDFIWPEIQPGEYFLTLGVGEGRDPIRHRIQCWAHNVQLFNAVSPGKLIHCLLNNPLKNFRYITLTDTASEPPAEIAVGKE